MQFGKTLAAVLLLALAASAQTAPEANRRPKIGLALEGGGALGLAHIAVLQWFEDHQVPVDYIAGTSMGALVGGMYAIGKTPKEIDDAVRQFGLEEILYGDTRFQDSYFRRKEEQRAYLNSLQFGLRSGFRLPSGLSTGQRVNFVLVQAALPYSGLPSFDDLPIPFRCVATDLVSGGRKVFDHGSLAEAMRASMSIPGVFTPVRTSGSVYVDGGLVDNLPADILKDMGAEVIIAVHLEKSAVSAESIQSVLDVLERSIDAVVRASEKRGIEMATVVIRVNVAGFGSTSYEQRVEIEKRGKEAAEAMAATLAAYRLEDADWKEYLAQRQARIRQSAPTPQRIRVEGAAAPVAQEIERRLKPFAGQPLDQDKFRQALTDLNRDDRFSRIEYHMAREGSQDVLVVDTQDPGYRVNRVRAGFEFDGSQPDEVLFLLAGGATFLDLGGLNSELRMDFKAGAKYRAAAEYFHPFTPESRWFVAPRAEAGSGPLNLYSHDSFLSGYRFDRTGGGVDLGYSVDRSSEVRVGYEIGHLRDSLRIGNSLLPQVEGRYGASTVRFRLDRVDDPAVPTEGIAWDIGFRWFDASPGATRGFPLAETQFGAYHSLNSRDTLFFNASGGTTFGHAATGLPQFFLGSLEHFAAYGSNELRTNQYFLFRAGYRHQIYRLSPLVGKGVYFTSAYEAGKVYGVSSASKLPNDFAAGVLVQTIFGPAFLGGSVGDTGHHKWFFQLGRSF